MDNVMVDLETMGTTPDSAIVSIGACEFDRDQVLAIGKLFYVRLDLGSSVRAGLKMDPDTVLWWMKQGDKARMEVARPQCDLVTGLQMFADFLASCGPTNDIKVWGNGPSFDNSMLAHTYNAAGIVQPWKFWNDRCMRTIKGEWPTIQADPREGTHHNALDDAIYQAEHLIKIRRTLNERRGV